MTVDPRYFCDSRASCLNFVCGSDPFRYILRIILHSQLLDVKGRNIEVHVGTDKGGGDNPFAPPHFNHWRKLNSHSLGLETFKSYCWNFQVFVLVLRKQVLNPIREMKIFGLRSTCSMRSKLDGRILKVAYSDLVTHHNNLKMKFSR